MAKILKTPDLPSTDGTKEEIQDRNIWEFIIYKRAFQLHVLRIRKDFGYEKHLGEEPEPHSFSISTVSASLERSVELLCTLFFPNTKTWKKPLEEFIKNNRLTLPQKGEYESLKGEENVNIRLDSNVVKCLIEDEKTAVCAVNYSNTPNFSYQYNTGPAILFTPDTTLEDIERAFTAYKKIKNKYFRTIKDREAKIYSREMINEVVFLRDFPEQKKRKFEEIAEIIRNKFKSGLIFDGIDIRKMYNRGKKWGL